MTQILLPGFPEGAERINTMLSILWQDKWSPTLLAATIISRMRRTTQRESGLRCRA